MQLERKFRIVADIVQAVQSGIKDVNELKVALSMDGMLRATEIESLTLLAKEIGFLQGNDDTLSPTKHGLAFEQYITSISAEEMSFQEDAPNRTPLIDKGSELKLCVTIPPKLMEAFKSKFGDSIIDTQTGRRYVIDECTDRIIIVSPYLDVSVLQLSLGHIYLKNTELIVITSEKDFIKFQHEQNFHLKKVKGIINNRFGWGRIFYLEELSSIVHAKVWCCQRSALVTSANMQSNSTTDNLEIGIYTNDPTLVGTLWSFLNFILSDGGMQCILDTRQ